jgi:hypothetical protein
MCDYQCSALFKHLEIVKSDTFPCVMRVMKHCLLQMKQCVKCNLLHIVLFHCNHCKLYVNITFILCFAFVYVCASTVEEYYMNICTVNTSDVSNMDLLQIKQFEKLECVEDRRKQAREIYDNFIMKELLSHSHVSSFVPVKMFFVCLIPCVQDGCPEPASGAFLCRNLCSVCWGKYLCQSLVWRSTSCRCFCETVWFSNVLMEIFIWNFVWECTERNTFLEQWLGEPFDRYNHCHLWC